MEITWHGNSCFRITERNHISVVTDPGHAQTDVAKLRLRANLVTVSHDRDSHAVEQIKDSDYVIAGPGEYEVGELFVTGIAMHLHDVENDRVLDNVAYFFQYPNNLNVLHLGALHQLPDQSIIEQLDDVNVLLLPVGGADLGGDKLADLISMIEPNFVVPMRPASVAGDDYSTAVDGFLKAMGVNNLEAQDGLRVTASMMPEQTQVVLLRADRLSQ